MTRTSSCFLVWASRVCLLFEAKNYLFGKLLVDRVETEKGGEMRLLPFLIFFGVLPALAFGSDAHSEQRIEAKLMRESVVNIAPAKETTYEDFVGDWGQFEVRVPKARFPIPAPHCRSNVILRMPGVAPDVPDREEKLAFNWRQFQSLHALQGGALEQLDIQIAPGPYMRINKQGQRELQYCNAYMDGRCFTSEVNA